MQVLRQMPDERCARYHDHGDTIAIQYGGSHLVNTMETYRKINQWTSHSRDMVESFKRYVNNSFLDRQRQEAYNLFLGNYTFQHGRPLLWDLSTDYYLHHADPRTWSGKSRKNYIQWYTPNHLDERGLSPETQPYGPLADKPLNFFDDYWVEYYRPMALSSLQRIFSYRMNSTLRYIPVKSTQEGKYDLSPFSVRASHDGESPEKNSQNKEGSKKKPRHSTTGDTSETAQVISPTKQSHLPLWLQSQLNEPLSKQPNLDKPSTRGEPVPAAKVSDDKPIKDKSAATQWTLNQFVSNALNPSVADTEAHEYERYIEHPQTVPLVTSTEIPPNANIDFVQYVESNFPDFGNNMQAAEDDVADYVEFLDIDDDALTVLDTDAPKKRYKAYRQWLRGKSLFKQQRVDP